jgi:hypothetical protein
MAALTATGPCTIVVLERNGFSTWTHSLSNGTNFALRDYFGGVVQNEISILVECDLNQNFGT